MSERRTIRAHQTDNTSPQPLLLFFCDTTWICTSLLELGRVTTMASCGCHVRLLLRIQISLTRPVQVLNRWSGWIRQGAALWPLAVGAGLCRPRSSSASPCAAMAWCSEIADHQARQYGSYRDRDLAQAAASRICGCRSRESSCGS